MRLRENGHVLAGDVWVVPREETDLVERIERLTEDLRELDWQLDDIVVSPVRTIEDAPEEIRVAAPPQVEDAGGEEENEPPSSGRSGFRQRLARLLRRG